MDIETDSSALYFVSLAANKIVSRNVNKMRIGNVPGFLKGKDIEGDFLDESSDRKSFSLRCLLITLSLEGGQNY